MGLNLDEDSGKTLFYSFTEELNDFSACFLSSSQKWTGEGKSPSMQGNPDADILREIVQLLGERIEQGLPTIFIKIKAHRGDPLNESADTWADEGRKSENIRWSLPSNRPIFYWTENGITHRSPMNPTVKKRINLQVSHNNYKYTPGQRLTSSCGKIVQETS